MKKLGDPELLKQLMPGISKYRPTVKFCLLLSALALLIVMLARPQMGSKISHDKRQGIETYHLFGYLQLYVGRGCRSFPS